MNHFIFISSTDGKYPGRETVGKKVEMDRPLTELAIASVIIRNYCSARAFEALIMTIYTTTA